MSANAHMFSSYQFELSKIIFHLQGSTNYPPFTDYVNIIFEHTVFSFKYFITNIAHSIFSAADIYLECRTLDFRCTDIICDWCFNIPRWCTFIPPHTHVRFIYTNTITRCIIICTLHTVFIQRVRTLSSLFKFVTSCHLHGIIICLNGFVSLSRQYLMCYHIVNPHILFLPNRFLKLFYAWHHVHYSKTSLQVDSTTRWLTENAILTFWQVFPYHHFHCTGLHMALKV